MPRLFEEPGADEYRGLDLRSLGIDHAWLVITSHIAQDAWLYARSDDCYRCAYKLMAHVPPGANATLDMDAKYGWSLRLRNDNASAYVADDEQDDSNVLCQVHGSMGEFGVYDVHLSGNGTTTTTTTRCDWSIAKEPVDIYMPLLACFVFYVILAAVWIATKAAYRRRVLDAPLRFAGLAKYAAAAADASAKSTDADADVAPSQEEHQINKRKRLKSLDTFRGISIVVMIFVNDGGGFYWFFEHATWNGLLVADLVFPWFMWIMGVCMPMSLRSSLRRRESRLSIFAGILRRSCWLFALGLVNNTLGANIDLHRLRIPGVLQRFAITYFVVSVVALVLTPSTGDLSAPSGSGRVRRAMQDVMAVWPQWIVMLALVAVHCLVTFLLPLEDGCPTGYIGPGGLHLDAAYPANCIGGAAGYIDRWLLGVNHIYNWPTARRVYESGPYDPEGVLGSLLSTFQVFLGYQAGVTLLVYSSWKSRVVRWMSWAALTGAIGAALCLASQEDGPIPVNKNLWSLSYVMVTSCFAFTLLSACYYFIDVKPWWTGAPFFYPGMNGILMYLGHQGAYALFPWHWVSGPMNTHFERLVETLWGVSLWVVIAAVLHRKKIFLAL